MRRQFHCAALRTLAIAAAAVGLPLVSSLSAQAQVYAPQPAPIADQQPALTAADCACAAPVIAPTVTYAPPAVAYRPVVTCAPRLTYGPVVAAPGPVVGYRPVVAYSPVVYARPAVVRTKVYYPGEPIRNFFKALVP